MIRGRRAQKILGRFKSDALVSTCNKKRKLVSLDISLDVGYDQTASINLPEISTILDAVAISIGQKR